MMMAVWQTENSQWHNRLKRIGPTEAADMATLPLSFLQTPRCARSYPRLGACKTHRALTLPRE
jgi:hypothetical protein